MLMSFVVKEKFGGEDLLLGKSFILVGKHDCLVGNLPIVDEPWIWRITFNKGINVGISMI